MTCWTYSIIVVVIPVDSDRGDPGSSSRLPIGRVPIFVLSSVPFGPFRVESGSTIDHNWSSREKCGSGSDHSLSWFVPYSPEIWQHSRILKILLADRIRIVLWPKNIMGFFIDPPESGKIGLSVNCDWRPPLTLAGDPRTIDLFNPYMLLFFALYSKNLTTTQTWKFLAFPYFLLRIPLWRKQITFFV